MDGSEPTGSRHSACNTGMVHRTTPYVEQPRAKLSMYGTQVAYWRTQSTDSNQRQRAIRTFSDSTKSAQQMAIVQLGNQLLHHGPRCGRLRLVRAVLAGDPDPPVWSGGPGNSYFMGPGLQSTTNTYNSLANYRVLQGSGTLSESNRR